MRSLYALADYLTPPIKAHAASVQWVCNWVAPAYNPIAHVVFCMMSYGKQKLKLGMASDTWWPSPQHSTDIPVTPDHRFANSIYALILE